MLGRLPVVLSRLLVVSMMLSRRLLSRSSTAYECKMLLAASKESMVLLVVFKMQAVHELVNRFLCMIQNRMVVAVMEEAGVDRRCCNERRSEEEEFIHGVIDSLDL